MIFDSKSQPTVYDADYVIDDGQPPPAKRARKHSDANEASLGCKLFSFLNISTGRANLIFLQSVTPPPESAPLFTPTMSVLPLPHLPLNNQL
jgi:hypothetical protein